MNDGHTVCASGIVPAQRGHKIIHEDIEDHAERVKIGCIIVSLSAVDFRCHILRSPAAAHGCLFIDGGHSAGNSEITEFVAGLFTEKQIAEFDVPVYDILFFAEGEGIADFGPQPDHFAAGHASRPPDIGVQGLQFFHADQDGAEALPPPHGIILDRDYVGVPFEVDHRPDLRAYADDEILNHAVGSILQEGVGR